MMEELHKVLDMEEALTRDAEGRYLRALREGFQTRIQELSRHLEGGLSQDEFRKHEDLRNALQSADALVEKVWGFLHNRGL